MAQWKGGGVTVLSHVEDGSKRAGELLLDILHLLI